MCVERNVFGGFFLVGMPMQENKMQIINAV